MSSNHHRGLVGPSNGEIDHVYYLSEHFGALYLNEDYSDIVLKVDDQRFHAHKVILAARSDYFRALLFGGMKESKQSEIELKGTSIDAFKGLLKYIYTGHMSLASLKEDVVLDILGLAHQYGFVDLETAISDFLRQALSLTNVCAIFDAARLYQLHYLTRVCASFVDNHAAQVIQHETFTQLSPGGLKELLERDSFYAPEVDIFQAVVDWAKANGLTSGAELEMVLGTVRLQLMTVSELLGVVRPLRLVTPDTILDALTLRTTCRDSALKYRGALKPEENVAHPNYGTQVLQGEMRTALLDGDCSNYDMERGYTRHAINEAGDNGILIKLGKQFIVNHVKMLLWDRDLRSYSYYIEVSMDQKDWTRVIDHTSYFCRSWQYLYFEPRVVRYVRIVGTNNTVNKVFHVVSFEIMYTNTPVNIEKGLIVPKRNVATISCSASVIEGVSRSRNALLDGETKRYDWDSGYTCHQLGSGSILVQLGQPYLLDSMRILLWDCDDRSYSYYVEVSVNLWDWELVWDKTRENCQSWQYITFPRRPVVFIRIIGTHNTANEVFHCVHLECPAQSEDAGTPRSTSSDPRPTRAQLPASSSHHTGAPDMVPTAAEATEEEASRAEEELEEEEEAVVAAPTEEPQP